MARSEAFQSLARTIRIACNQPGYFTTIADNEQKPVGNLFFAGEHTSSFYEFQGFMEGGAVSGLRAAAEVLRAL